MGRLTGIRLFFTQEVYDEEKRDLAELRRAKALLGDDYNPLDAGQGDDCPIREAQMVSSLRIQQQFEQRVLRRSIDSTDWEGKKLVDLPPVHQHMVLLSLQPFEQEIHAQLTADLREK
jgi:hypothetical protein